MTHYAHISLAEEHLYGRAYIRKEIKAGDTVDFGAWRITIDERSLDCDCGKGVYCPYNKQTRR